MLLEDLGLLLHAVSEARDGSPDVKPVGPEFFNYFTEIPLCLVSDEGVNLKELQ